VPLSRSPDFHAVIHRRAGTRCPIPFTVCFSDFHAFTLRLVPHTAMSFLFTARACFPVALRFAPRTRPVSTASPTSKPYPSCESVSPGLGFPSPTDRYSPGFLPLQSFYLHTSDSRPAWTRRPKHSPFLRRFRARDSKDLSPSCQVKPSQHQKARGRPRRRIPAPFEAGPHHR
jgi:hypothetical protein